MNKLLIFLILASIVIDAAATNSSLNWKFQTGGRIYSSPVIDGDLVFFGSGDSCFYAVNRATGKQSWCFRTKGAIHSSPEIYKNLVYFGSADGNLYALNKTTGVLAWKYTSESEKMLDIWDYYLSSPKIENGTLY